MATESSLNKLFWSLFKLGCWALLRPWPSNAEHWGWQGWPCWDTANFKSGSHGRGKTSILLAKLSQSNVVFRLREEAAREHTHNPFFGYLALTLSEVMDYIREEQRPHTTFSCVSVGHPGREGPSTPSPPVVPHRAHGQGDRAWPLFQ